MKTRDLTKLAIAAGVTGALFAACSAGPSNQQTSGTNGAGGAGGAGSLSSGSLVNGSNGAGLSDDAVGVGVGGFPPSGGNGSGTGGAETCAGETSKAELIPLDIYLMLDSSGSMNDTTGQNNTGPSKWDAVTQALTTFFKDPSSAGLGLGLNHFPVLGPGVPASCTSNAQCPGASGPCLLKACTGTAVLTACTTNSNCASGNCVTLGDCGGDLCGPAGSTCTNGLICTKLTSSTCASPDSCGAVDYAKPQVEVSPLNSTTAAALTGAISKITPNGATPTSAALQGAINHAKEYAGAHPTHTVIVLLATDGLPTECSPTDIGSIANIAASGLSGTPSVQTFVIGVFAPTDTGAPGNLNKIAVAGGTKSAFIVDTSKNVSQAFLDALNAIRGTKLACEYEVPKPGDAGALDFDKVNVEYTKSGSTTPTTIPYVATGASACNAMTGGWYYDVDPSKGGTPTKIIMCPATCSAFGLDSGGQVDIRVGCKTVVAPPPK